MTGALHFGNLLVPFCNFINTNSILFAEAFFQILDSQFSFHQVQIGEGVERRTLTLQTNLGWTLDPPFWGVGGDVFVHNGPDFYIC